MKTKLVISLAVSALFMAGSSVVLADDAQALAKKSGCFACHAIDKKVMGPAWNDIGTKYKGHKAAELVASIKNGSKGKWGTMPMPPQAKVSDADAATLATYILSLAK